MYTNLTDTNSSAIGDIMDDLDKLNDTIFSSLSEVTNLYQTDISQLRLSILNMNSSWKTDILDLGQESIIFHCHCQRQIHFIKVMFLSYDYQY